MPGTREGSLEAPQRHTLDWKSPEFNSEQGLFQELERVFDICHGCRRCFNLCNTFPTLFDAIDQSETMEIDGVSKEQFWDVVDNCYLCDLCFMTKCPYVPPHEWQVDFPHLMLRAKIVGNKKGRPKRRDKLLSSTDRIGKVASIPVAFRAINAVNRNSTARKALENTLGVHRNAKLPEYSSFGVHRKFTSRQPLNREAQPAGPTKGRIALFATCYGKYSEPGMNQDIAAVFEHNEIPVQVVQNDQCCGMPKLEIGDMKSIERLKNVNIPVLASLARDGWDLITSIPSCSLMFRQELPLLFPDDEDVLLVRDSTYDPFEYLMLRHKYKKLKTKFTNSLGSVVYQVACHQRVQNFGSKTRDALSLIPDTDLTVIERCSGHNGTYAVKKEFHDYSMKIAKPIVNRVLNTEPDHLTSDCVLAARHIENGVNNPSLQSKHPITLMRIAYGI